MSDKLGGPVPILPGPGLPNDPDIDPGGGTPFSDNPLEHSILSATFMVGIMVTWLILGHKIQGMFSWTKWISEGSMACLLGVMSGVLLLLWDWLNTGDTMHRSLSFDSAIFFTYMLPPIIFYGGLAIKRKLFVNNLMSICLFGILGTFVSFTMLGAFLASLSLLPNVLSFSDCFSLAAIFAATDSVAVLQVLRPESQPALYSIVLGEGVMNDAASVALLKAVNNLSDSADLSFTTLLFLLTFFVYVFVASFALGLTSGLAIAWMMKHLGPFSQPQEVSLVGALAFLCYLIAELLGLSGILALFFCGMAVSHYALQHVSRPSQAALLNAFRTLSYLLEGFIFLYVGRDALDPVKWANASFLQTVMLLVIITTLVALSRAAFVFPCAWIHNRFSQQGSKLSVNECITIWWAGMMRGAVSVAMVYYRFDPKNHNEDSHSATIVVTTLQVVLYSTVGMGGVTGPLLQYLLPQQVSPPDVTGAQLVASGMGSGATSPNMSPRPGSVDDRLLGSHTMFPTVEDMPPSPTGSEDYYGTFFQSRSQKAHTDAMPLLDTGPSVLQNEHGGGRATRSATTDNQISVAMKPVDSGAGDSQSQHPSNCAQSSPHRTTQERSSQVSGTSTSGIAQEVGASVLNAVQNIAELTDFQAFSSENASRRGMGDAMMKRFKNFDARYLQPAFGKQELPSEGPPNVTAGIPADEHQDGEELGQGSEPRKGGPDDGGKQDVE